jgi:hypothetical protein
VGLPKELINRKILTLNRRDKVIRTIVNYKNLNEEWKEKVENTKRIIPPKLELKRAIERETDRGFKKGNKPKILRKIYEGNPRNEEMNKPELRSDAAVIFISHNINMSKW